MELTIDKVYIGKVEAYEIAMQRGIEKLPRKSKEIWTVYPKVLNKPADILGKDEQGYYVATGRN